MLIMRLRHHPKLRNRWPPATGRALLPRAKLQTGEADILEEVHCQARRHIVMQTRYEGLHYSRDLFLTDSKFAMKLFSYLQRQVGRTIEEIGDSDIEDS